jgi:hypothetical protein
MANELDTVTDSEMNEFVHKVAEAMEELLGIGLGADDRCELNAHLEQLLVNEYKVRVVEDPLSPPQACTNKQP